MESKLYTIYKKDVVPALKEELNLSNVMEVPKIEKVVVNVGYGKHSSNKSYVETVTKTLEKITGQKPVQNRAKKSISNFKIREGLEIGASVTLRGKSMYEFLYRLTNLALPRVRDFRGLTTKAFDKQGNYSIGLKENIAFPEIEADTVDQIHGLQVVITTTAKNPEQGKLLLEKLGFPFKKDKS